MKVAETLSLPPKPLAPLGGPPHAHRPTSHPAGDCSGDSALSTPPQPEQLSVGQWTQSQLLSPETLPSVAALGAGGRGEVNGTSDGASQAQGL
jgi:hypothetical protein